MAALTWTTLQTAIAAALVQAPSPYTALPPDFLTLFPQATSYAEGRIYRDLVLLATRTQDMSLTTVAGARALALGSMTKQVIVVEGVALIASGVRYSFDAASLDVVDLVWPQQGLQLAPASADWKGGRWWAMRDDQTIVICPTPDAAYQAEITGLFQPASISVTNASTYLSTTYPDLLTAAVMIWLSGALLRNYGAQTSEPQQGMSWEQQYGLLRASAEGEEQRRRGLGPDFKKG